MSQEIRIPDIGDAESVEVVEILVAAGDAVGADDPVIVIESDKASMEVPAGTAGVIERVTVAVGDHVVEGQVIATLTGAAAAVPPAAGPVAGVQSVAAAPSERVTGAAPPGAGAGAGAAAGVPSAIPQPVVSVPPGAAHDVRVPDIGEAEHVSIVEIAVSIGDRVEAGDLLVVIESDKASMEIPVGVAGRVVALHVKEGDEVRAGALLATVETALVVPADRGSVTLERTVAATAAAPRNTDRPAVATGVEGSPPAVAAAAPIGPAVTARPLRGAPAAEAPAAQTPAAETAGATPPVYAGPAVRRLARELGVRLEQVAPSGPRGRIVKDDVKAFVKTRLAVPPAAAGGGGFPQLPEVDFSRFGPIEVLPLSRIRARGAENLHRSWVNIPHVTQHDEVDVSDLEAFRKSLKAEAEAQGIKLTPLAFLIKACCQVLHEFPTFNASLDPAARNFILKRYCNIGIAVDTDEGLVVPVIRDADQKGIWALAREAAELSEKARNRKLSVADHQGGTFSITSLGALGGTGFTPIINAPEVAILGVSRLVTRPQWNGQAFVPREMLPLSLSYDHRAVNGAEGGRFVARLAQLLGDIRRLAL